MPPAELRFADLHFHTHYSDNRDRATVEAMVDAGQRHSVSVFGVGDHNHNLDGRKWRALARECAALRRRRPSLVLLRNCEITFLMGHFLAVEPGSISGSVAEGYAFLYGNRRALTVINHPDGILDEWDRRPVASASAIEVINGAVLDHAWERGLRLRTAMDLPSLRIYAAYLGRGLPVAAMGASDAHHLGGMGRGMTGLWMDAPSAASVLRAIRGRRTFATTEAGIRLQWSLDAASRELRWQVEWRPRDPAAGAAPVVEVYRGGDLVERAAASSGATALGGEGLYWIAALGERGLAVSSPVGLTVRGGAARGPAPASRESIADAALLRMRGPAGLRLRARAALAARTDAAFPGAEADLWSWGPRPVVTDASGRPVPYQAEGQPQERVVMDKRCAAPCFDEFLLWLRRNEIHEYSFVDLAWTKRGDVLELDARIAPAIMILPRIGGRRRGDLERIRSLIDERTSFHLSVRTLFRCRVRLPAGELGFPLQVDRPRAGWRSLLVRPGRGPLVCPVLVDARGPRSR